MKTKYICVRTELKGKEDYYVCHSRQLEGDSKGNGEFFGDIEAAKDLRDKLAKVFKSEKFEVFVMLERKG